MAKKDLQKNLEKMKSSGYFSEEVKIDKNTLSFSLDNLDDSPSDKKTDETRKKEK